MLPLLPVASICLVDVPAFTSHHKDAVLFYHLCLVGGSRSEGSPKSKSVIVVLGGSITCV